MEFTGDSPAPVCYEKQVLTLKKGYWGTRFGFYFAAIGTAFGLGNLWRFPYVVSENGGGAFVLLYVFLVFVVGIPLLLSELLLGKSTRKSVVAALQQVEPKESSLGGTTTLRWLHLLSPYVSRFVIILCLIVLSYFAVISGWVFYFFMHFFLTSVGIDSIPHEALMSGLRDNGWLQVLLTFLHLSLVIVIVAKDVEEGTEKWVGYMMPVFAILLIVLVGKSLSLDTSEEGLRYFLYPDFSKLNYSSLSDALGHVLFTLSIGFGTMVTFGSYLRKRSLIPTAGLRVATVDSCLSLFSGLLIFPLVIMGTSSSDGPELLFQTVPMLLGHMPGGHLFGMGFFLCLYLAALGASIGLLESVVANLEDVIQIKRPMASIAVGLICVSIALFPALSSSLLSNVRWGNKGLLEMLDRALINWALPLAALLVSQIVCYQISDQKKREEFIQEENVASLTFYSHWLLALKWIVPFVILLAFALELLGLFLVSFD